MLPARSFSISIRHDWRALYERIWRPEFFPKWAAGLADGELRQGDDGSWLADGADGPVGIRFTPHNPFGVMDHWVDAGPARVHVPLRVVENGDGAEVILTLYRQPGMDEERFSADIKLVNRDLKALKNLIERGA
ncbi:polyketide cyclase [Novosphingobium sp.]|uniref:polyketide cyclase n=1 Tax=Novosphingobium sp. TaxID=1874826 RepID=UPI003B524326